MIIFTISSIRGVASLIAATDGDTINTLTLTMIPAPQTQVLVKSDSSYRYLSQKTFTAKTFPYTVNLLDPSETVPYTWNWYLKIELGKRIMYGTLDVSSLQPDLNGNILVSLDNVVITDYNFETISPLAPVKYYTKDEVDQLITDLGSGGLSSEVSWANITDKPDAYPPVDHNHDLLYYRKTDLDTTFNDIGLTLDSKAPENHDHNDLYFTKTEVEELIDAIPTGSGSSVIQTVSVAANLPDSNSDGTETTFHALDETIFSTAAGTITLEAGWWSFIRDSSVPSGWKYWSLATPATALIDGAVVLVEVTPPMPIATDPSGTANDGVTIPDIIGVIYRDGLVDLIPGFYEKSGSFSITPVATSGYVLVNTPNQWDYDLSNAVISSWSVYTDVNFASAANNTPLQGYAGTNGTTVSAIDPYGNWNVSTAVLIGGALQSQANGNAEFIQFMPLPAPAGTTSGRRITIWYDATANPPVGYESKVGINFSWLSITMVRQGSAMVLDNFSMHNVTPKVTTVEEGVRTGLPLSGTITMEVDSNGYDVRAYVNDILKASCNISSNLYVGAPVNIRNEAGTAKTASTCMITRTLHEVYA